MDTEPLSATERNCEATVQRDFSRLSICNPKQQNNIAAPNSGGLFPYYAGYSATFARQLLSSAGLHKNSSLLDPWNGAGTTTSEGNKLGFSSIGVDLNPVMVVAAKASMLGYDETPS